MIHPTAIIHPQARLDPTVRVGPYSVVDESVVVGAHCIIGPHVHLTGRAVVGTHNRFHAGCVIGDAPQDLKYQDEPTGLRIGDHNVFREHTTVHRSSKVSEDTIIGSNCYLMQHSHVGHNVRLGNQVIVAGGALLAGHVTVEDRAFISGNCLVHQFVRIGQLSMMQGGSAISKDLPPFTIARDNNSISGLNVVGLRRAGFSSEDRLDLKRAYHLLFRTGGRFAGRVSEASIRFTNGPALELVGFCANAKRGVCADLGSRFARRAATEGKPDGTDQSI